MVGALLDASLRAGVTLQHGVRPFVNLRYLGGGAEGTTGDYDGYGGDGFCKKLAPLHDCERWCIGILNEILRIFLGLLLAGCGLKSIEADFEKNGCSHRECRLGCCIRYSDIR